MDEPLAAEWAAYRAACDAVDVLRRHSTTGDPDRRLRVAERVLERRRAAVSASERLLRRAEREPRIDPTWLDELRDAHEDLVRSLPRDERHIAEALHRTRAQPTSRTSSSARASVASRASSVSPAG